MAKPYCYLLIILLTGLINDAIAQAPLRSGGELTYEYSGSPGSPNLYEVTLILFKSADTLNIRPKILINSSCYGTDTMRLKPYVPMGLGKIKDGGVVISSRVNCNDTLSPDSIQPLAYYYKDTVTLPGQCSDFEFTYYECCRNSLVSNIAQPDSTGFYLISRLNNTNGPNSAPRFIEPPRQFFCKNQEVKLFNWAVEPDGDSLNFSLIGARDSLGQPVTYAMGFSAANPVSSSTPFSLQSFTPSQAGIFTLAIEVQEYRYNSSFGLYYQVGSVVRDYNLVVRDSCPSFLYSSYPNGLILSDSLYTSHCGDSTITIKTKPFLDYGFENAEFRIIGADFVIRPISEIQANFNPALYSDSITLKLHRPIQKNGGMRLFFKAGGLLNPCGNVYSDDQVFIVIDDCSSMGLADNDMERKINLYPNPAEEELKLSTGEIEPSSLTIFNMDGRKICSVEPTGSSTVLNISELGRGMYLLKIDFGDWYQLEKFQRK